MTTKVGITGSRDWMPRKLIYDTLDECLVLYPDMFLIVGDADGVDAIAREWAQIRNCPYREYYANWDAYGLGAGPERNERMVRDNEDAIVWLAFPLPSSKGTKDCIDRAKAAGIEVREFSIHDG